MDTPQLYNSDIMPMPKFNWVVKDPSAQNPYKTQLGIDLVSRVDDPAMEGMFTCLSKTGDILHTEDVKLAFDDTKQWVIGAVLVPGKEILQKFDKNTVIDNVLYPAGTIYKTSLSAQEIEFALEKFFYDKNIDRTNLQHAIPNSGDFLIMSWIKLTKNDMSNDLYPNDNYPIGTLFLGYKILDKTKFVDIKLGKSKQFGFSVEANFGLVPVYNNNTQLQTNKNITMKKFENVKLTDLALQDGRAITIDDTSYAVTFTADSTVVPDGEYILSDGSTITVAGGIVASVNMMSANSSDLSKIKEDEKKDIVIQVVNTADDNKDDANKQLPGSTTVTMSTISIEELMKQVEDIKGQFSATKIELEAIKNKSIELQEKNTELEAKNAQLSKLPTVHRLNTVTAANADSTKVQLSAEDFDKLPMWQKITLGHQQALANKIGK